MNARVPRPAAGRREGLAAGDAGVGAVAGVGSCPARMCFAGVPDCEKFLLQVLQA